MATGVASRLASTRQAARFVIRWRTAAVTAAVKPDAAARGQRPVCPPCPRAVQPHGFVPTRSNSTLRTASSYSASLMRD